MQLFNNPKVALATAATSLALLGAGAVGAVVLALDEDTQSAAPTRVVTVAGAAPAASGNALTVAEIYKRSSKSVVEITTSASQETPFGGQGQAQSQGSGFVYDAEGHVITNQHVVDGADAARVTFSDGETYDATVVGTDPSTDLAVLKVDAPASALAPLALADSDDLEVGEGVVAIGSPFGLEQTVTAGIVSALHRQITAPNDFAIDDAIQTDAAINHGNSGGPLLDLNGRVVGVNSQIESQSGGNDGVGFAVPSNTVKRVAEALIADGEIQHAYLGVATEDAADVDGARLAEVRTGTPADDAGLQAGDVVTAVGDEEVGSADELRQAIDAHSPGDRVELTLERDGETETVTVTLGTRPNT